MTDIYNKIANLSPEKRRILEQKLKQNKSQTSNSLIAKNADKPEEIPLSSAQMRMWILNQFEPGNSAYNRLTNFKLTGVININFLQQSLDKIIDRHEILRTSFLTNNKGLPKQKICDRFNLNLPIVDLSNLSNIEQENKIKELAINVAKHPFDLSKLPLINAVLLKLKQNEHILLLNFHHIIFDGWSAEILLNELKTIYTSFTGDKSLQIPKLSIQYADFAIWQQKQVEKGVFNNQLAYWKNKLQGELPVLNLPADRSRGAEQTFNGSKVELVLNSKITRSLKDFSLQENATLYMTLLAAFKVLLYKYTQQEDIIIGSPIAGRDRTETESLIGIFINTLAIRTKINPNLTFKQFLAQLKQTILEAQNNKDIPFDKVIDNLNLTRNLSHSSVFQVLFQLKNMPQSNSNSKDLIIEKLDLELETVMLDLMLEIEVKNQELKCIFKYNTDLFNAATIKKISSDFIFLLQKIISDSKNKINDFLSIATEKTVLNHHNYKAIDYSLNKSIHQLFEEQVTKTPNAVAVVYENKKLTYKELNNRANQLAHYLQNLGVKPETLIAIYIERSLEMLIGLLAILKAGGAYIPLDSKLTKKRLNYILKDSQAKIIITQSHLFENISLNDLIINIDTDWHHVKQYSIENTTSKVKPDNLAYIIYTSGSTGKPKGVLVSHNNVVRLFFATNHLYNFGQNDVWTLFHSYAFDFSVWEIWGALLYGGKLVIVPYLISRSPQDFYQLLLSEKVTVLNQTPSAFYQLISTDINQYSSEKLELKWIIFGGEALNFNYLKPWFDKYGNCQTQLVNMYGITETTVHATYKTIKVIDLNEQKSLIGFPLSDLQFYLLDNNLQPVADGYEGEIYISGAGVTRGYLNRPELTASRFIYNPFQDNKLKQKNYSKLYKTGDLGRYLPNGELEYLGRIDNQIKIRGFRIELEEIETVIAKYFLIKQAVVVVKSDENALENKILIAFFTTGKDRKELNFKELRNFLAKQLPDYMIPSTLIPLKTLPLTLNGKIDRQKLSTLDYSKIQLRDIYIEPKTEIEKQLANILSDVLNVKNIGIQDNFWELGLNSISATRIIARIDQQMRIKVSIKALFKNSKIADLSKVITSLIETDTVIEDRLIKILQGILAIKNIDAEDNILELGIDSLSAMRLVSRISQQMQIEIKINTIFQYPTVAKLGEEIQRLRLNSSLDNANNNSLSSVEKHKKSDFSCCLIGEQAFISQCAKLLLKKGHKITGIISTGSFISDWANAHNISFIEPKEDIFNFLQQQSFDYLFSVYNLKFLSPEITKLAKKATINCHDSLLPRYGGMHSTSWAILNQERTHGITWHLVNSKIDEGDILLQKQISISDSETAFTLNNKCYQEILSSFSQLIDSLIKEELSAIPQKLTNKSYYFASEKPSIGCLLSFEQSADRIDSFIRSLDFSVYPNYIGLPKLAIKNDFIIVSKIKMLQKLSKDDAGKIIAIKDDYIQVSTTTSDIELIEFKSITGEPLSVKYLAEQYSLTVGYQFKPLPSQLLNKIKNIEKKSFYKEKFWLNKLNQLKPIKLSYTAYSSKANQINHAWSIPNKAFNFIKNNDLNKFEFLLTTLICYLSRINNNYTFDIGYKSYLLQNKISEINNLFESTIPLKINIDLDFNFKETLDWLQKEIILVEKNQTYSKDIILRHSIKEKPKFSVIIERVKKLIDYKKTESNDFTFVVSEEENYCYLVYNEQQFTKETILQFSKNLTLFSENIVENTEVSLNQILLSNEESKNLLDHNLEQYYKLDINYCIHQLFENQAVETPNAIAVTYEKQFITYQELNYRANQLARYLQKLGTNTEDIIAIYLPKSIALIISLLATLKSGAAYLPIDTKYPLKRIKYIIKDAEVKTIITVREFSHLWESIDANVIYIDKEKAHLFKNSTENLDLPIQPHNLAYVIYTSGSTGKPKGVAIEHHSLVNFVRSAISKYQITSNDTILQFASVGFDTAVEEIYTCLTTGATLVLRTEEMLGSTAKFLEHCHNYKITVLDLPTAYWHQITEDLNADNISLSPFLRLIIIGGEKALSSKVALWRKHTGGYPELINTYGPTEATVVTTAYKITANISTDIDIPIGKPLANIDCHILDSHLQQLPPGVPGELYIGGAGVAREYLNRPQLNQEKFIDNPFDNYSRLYKTGDKALCLPDGNIQFLGRVDNQVKVRGFRVELGEIEAALRNYSFIKDVVVTSIKSNLDNVTLAAYFVPYESNQAKISDIKRYLADLLPEYAIPSIFIPLKTLPITVNGKIDKQSLPTPQWQTKQTDVDDNSSTNTTSVETKLIEIWQNVLEREQIDIEDDFFAIGGHSLLAVQVSNQIAQKLQVDISLKKIFEYPTIKELSHEIEKLTPSNTNKTNSASSPNPSISETIPLSFAQTRLWFLEQLEPGKITYTIPFALNIVGILNTVALKASLNQIVKRHEVLRTRFITVEGKPQQKIESYAALDIPVVDLSQHPKAEAQTQAWKIVDSFKRESFDLTSAPLIKAQLLRLSQNEHWLVINIHHIAFDGWSRDIFNRELSALYSAYCKNIPSPLQPLTTQYADFAQWQRQYLQQDKVKQQLNYWRNQLSGDLPRLQLPTDYPRPQTISYKGTREIFSLNSQLTAQLRQLSRQHKSTLFMTMLTAFKVLLYRYTSQRDIVVGSPIAERNQPETADLIGFLVNTLVLRSHIAPETSFISILKQVKETALSAYENQDIPFDKLVEELAPQRDSRYTPLFHVCFVMQGASKGLKLKNLTVNPLNFKAETAKFDLSLSLQETATGIDGAIVYSTDLFKATTIQRMVNNFQTLLESIVAQPDEALCQLPLLTSSEKKKLLIDWNNTQTDYPQKPISKLFEIQVDETPNAVALVYEEQQLTYQQLNCKANQLARYLQKLGIQSQDVVGICLERSFETIIALLAIVKLGAIYLPLDITYPQERLEFMISESKVKALVTNASLSSQLQNYCDNQVYVDKDWNKITQQSDNNLEINVRLEDLAYIMYTSGSTGKPKGVCVKHRGIVRLVKNNNYASLDSQQIFLQLAPISFDAATLEIWGSLLNGAKLVLYLEGAITLEKLEQVIHQHRVSFLFLTAALFNLVIDEKITALQPVKQLLSGGDVLSIPHVQKALSTLDNCQLINCYGPTENTTFTTYYPINQLQKYCKSIPIGKPIANTQVYILDTYLQPVPIGVAGELYITGDGLAQGYLNRPELNAKRFISNPFEVSQESVGCKQPFARTEVRGIHNERLYKTGDLVRYLEDGNIEFIGRIDNQVKVRGYRIELGEIEAALTKHPQIKDVIVLAQKTFAGDKNLIAYLIAEENQPSSQELRKFLGDKLPNYMIPNSYLFLKQFPLSPNGKVQRQALLKLQFDTSEKIQRTLPHNEIESKLVQIWQQILNIASVSVTDDFFDLGGNSLLSIALIAAVEKAFKQKISVSNFFQLSTIEQLAEAIAKQQTTKQQTATNSSLFVPNSDSLYQLTEREYSMLLASTVPEKRVVSDRSLITLEKPGNPQVKKPLFFVYLLGDFAQYLDSDLPVYKLNIATTVIERPETYIKALATHYVREIRKIQPEGKYYIGGYCVGGHVALEIARQLKAQKQEVANLVLVETATFNPVYLHYQSLIAGLGYRVWLKFLTRIENLKGASFAEKMALLKEISLKLPAKIGKKIAPQPITNYPEPTVEMQIRHVLKLAMRGYRMDAYYGKATLFLAQRSTLRSPIFPLGGWKKFFKRELNCHLIPGDHVTINEGKNAVLLAKYINKYLD